MDIIEELQEYKRHFGFSNEIIAERSGVPFGTVQKIFGGVTKAPRRKTLLALESFFRSLDDFDDGERYTSAPSGDAPGTPDRVGESVFIYGSSGGTMGKAAGDGSDGDVGWIITKMPKDDPDYPGMLRLTFTRQGTYTIEDLNALPDGVRAELIDGQNRYRATQRLHRRARIQNRLMLNRRRDDVRASAQIGEYG